MCVCVWRSSHLPLQSPAGDQRWSYSGRDKCVPPLTQCPANKYTPNHPVTDGVATWRCRHLCHAISRSVRVTCRYLWLTFTGNLLSHRNGHRHACVCVFMPSCISRRLVSGENKTVKDCCLMISCMATAAEWTVSCCL